MINQKAAQEREALLKRLRELHGEIVELQRQAKQAEAQISIEEQFRLNLKRLIAIKLPHTSGKARVEIAPPGAYTEAVFSGSTRKPPGTSRTRKFLSRFGRRSFV